MVMERKTSFMRCDVFSYNPCCLSQFAAPLAFSTKGRIAFAVVAIRPIVNSVKFRAVALLLPKTRLTALRQNSAPNMVAYLFKIMSDAVPLSSALKRQR